METRKLQFVLQGFNDTVGRRVFSFEGIAADRTRTSYTVSADLSLTRQYGIRLQELPLLCRTVLEQGASDTGQRTFSFTESEMRQWAEAATAAREAAAKLRKPPRRPAVEKTGTAWRGPAAW